MTLRLTQGHIELCRNMKMTLLYLTCKDNAEADMISTSLLEKKLVVCAKKLPVSSSFLWKGGIDKSDEILVLLETDERLFDEIEAEIKKLHSYETFILASLPITRVSKGVEEWVTGGLKNNRDARNSGSNLL